MFKSNIKYSVSSKLRESYFSPVCRRKMRRYKESVSSSLPDSMSMSMSSSLSTSSKSLTKMTSQEEVKDESWGRCLWSSPKLRQNTLKLTNGQKESGTSSEWTKIRLSLEFIRKSKEVINSKKISDESQNAKTRRYGGSLTFIGQVYADTDADEDVFALELENIQI